MGVTVSWVWCADMDDKQYQHTDRSILQMIDLVRDEHGACTAAQVGNRLNISADVVVERCQALAEQGLVTWTALPGSLHRIIDPAQRLYDLTVQSAVESMALEFANGEHANAEHESVREWSYSVVALATARAWPELCPGPLPEGGEEPEPAAVDDEGVDAAPSPLTNDDGKRCEVCDRTFKHSGAIVGHLRSKAHVAAVQAAAA